MTVERRGELHVGAIQFNLLRGMFEFKPTLLRCTDFPINLPTLLFKPSCGLRSNTKAAVGTSN